jgi:hypothetical protein
MSNGGKILRKREKRAENKKEKSMVLKTTEPPKFDQNF